MNAIELLLKDHREQERLLDLLKKTSSNNLASREVLYNQFRQELIKHINIEEEILYPPLKKIESLEPKVLEALEEHKLCMTLLQEIDYKNVDDKVWAAKLEVLNELTKHHIKEEEEDLFPQVKELASQTYLKEMAEEMQVHKENTNPEKVLYPEN